MTVGPPTRRVVLLGASNLTRAFATVVETAKAYWGGPLEVLAALGHGRSYGMDSAIFVRRLPGILGCGLWDALADDGRPTAAMMTDIGNDLLYEVPPLVIADWVRRCADRLVERCDSVVMTLLPLANSEEVSELRFSYLRNSAFPGSDLTLAELAGRAAELDAALRTICAERGIATVEHRRDWYGFDPIHIRMRCWASAWQEVLAPWRRGAPAPAVGRVTRRRHLRLRLLPPQQRWICGIPRHAAQPAGPFEDGSTIAVY